MDENQAITLNTYNRYPERYLQTTSQDMKWSGTAWVDEFLSLLPADSVILEIGSATGRDARYIERRGFRVFRTDAAAGFVSYMKAHGEAAELYNPLESTYHTQYDAIFAAAVLLHFNDRQLETVLTHLLAKLPRQGLMLFWTKQGEGEEYSSAKMDSPRYFRYWQPKSLRPILRRHGLSIVREGETEGGKWLHYIVRKD